MLFGVYLDLEFYLRHPIGICLKPAIPAVLDACSGGDETQGEGRGRERERKERGREREGEKAGGGSKRVCT